MIRPTSIASGPQVAAIDGADDPRNIDSLKPADCEPADCESRRCWPQGGVCNHLRAALMLRRAAQIQSSLPLVN